MSRVWRLVVGAAFVAVATVGFGSLASTAAAQPGFGKGGFGKGGFDKGGFEKERGKGEDREKEKEKAKEPAKGGERGPDGLRALEAELAKLREMERDLEAKLRGLREPAKGDEPRFPGFPGGFGPGGFGPPGLGGGRGGFPFERAGLERLSDGQIKEAIAMLQKILDERTKAPAPRPTERPKTAEPRPVERPKTPERPAANPTNDEILRKLELLAKELEELRRSIKK